MPKTDLSKLRFPNPTAETKRRIREVLKKIQEAWQKYEVVDWLCTMYDISEAQAKEYWHDAIYFLQNDDSLDDRAVEDVKATQISKITAMQKAAEERNDWKTAVKCQDMLNKIYQLYVDKKEVTVNSDTIRFEFDMKTDDEQTSEGENEQ